MLPSLSKLSDKLLLDNVRNLKQIEDKTIADLVLYLAEVDTRKLYRNIGFSSLFSYCTSSLSEGGLGYSEGSAYRRMQAARSLKDNPEIYELLQKGKLSLCAVAEISKVIKIDNKTELLELSQGKPKSEVQKITARYQAPVMPLKKERITAKKVLVENKDPLFSLIDAPKATEETRFTFTVEVDVEFMELLKDAKDIVGFAPSVEVIKRTLKEFVAKRKVQPTKVPKFQAGSRYIPKAIKYQVRQRDQHQCTFTNSSGRRCTETCGLELDHIEPFAFGGTNEASNLRLLCPAHNQLFAEKAFGRDKIESFFKC